MLRKLIDRKKDSGFVRYLINTSWGLGEKVLRIFGALFVGVWVARYLGPDDLGILSYAQSLVALFLALSTFGLEKILLRELVKSPEKQASLLGTSFLIQTFGSVFLITGLLVTINMLGIDPYTRKLILILGLVTFVQSFNVIGVYFQSQVKSKFLALANSVSLIISSGIKILLIVYEYPLIFFVYAIAFETLLNAAFLVRFYKGNGYSLFSWKASRRTALYLLRDSWPLLLNGVIVSIYMKIDQVMIKEFLDNNSVGIYSAAVRLSEAWYFIPTIISASLFPAIVNAKNASESLYYNRLQRLYDFMFLLALGVAIPITLGSDWLVNALYGSEFNASSQILTIHIWTGIFVFLGVSRGGWIINENLQRYSTLYLLIGMCANVVLNYYLINTNGVIGAAFATLIAQAISVLIAPALFKKTRLSFVMMLKSILFISVFSSLNALINERKTD